MAKPYQELPFQKERLDERKALFKDCDPNGNLYCSLAEIDAILSDDAKWDYGDISPEDRNSCMLHAFDTAKNFGGDQRGCASDYIEHKEFRIFLELFVKKLSAEEGDVDGELEELND
eukprot:gnl/TRDRNA2_/TRDRNA2_131410_c0_seq1.p1 gnl/TRDRNA2_/TRDRNA2_131410_c0~~gnl/TRDRNA2_/TRDRNA2_131410_c0_seq1.p1  ORF type:complete len:117 (-),score=38.32 gnl/TRDRNA2_/TRDRNA2_131410_c0_seq1:71-421(-)